MSKMSRLVAMWVAAMVELNASAAQFGAELKVSGYSGSSTLENFPVLVKLAEHDTTAGTGISGFDYDDLAHPESGADIWFSSDAAGGNVIPHDIDEWHRDGTSLVWVSLPAMAADTTFYLHYGTGSTPTYTPSNVWLNANYAGVWHMNEPDGNVADATGHGLAAVPSGSCKDDSVREEAGVIGGCRQNAKGTRTSGKNSTWLKVSNSKQLNENGRATVSCWFKFRTGTENANSRVFSSKNGYSDGSGFCGETATGGGSITLRAGGGSGCGLTLSSYGNWNHMVVSYDGTVIRAWHNGGAHSASSSCSSIGSISTDIGLGSNRAGGEPALNGWMDEYRLRSVASSADWAKAEYETATKDGFVTAGEVYDASRIVAVTGSPDAYGVPTPNYGAYVIPAVGQHLEYTAPAFVYLNADETERMALKGWKVCEAGTSRVLHESEPGQETTCAFDFEGACNVVWLWERQFKVTVRADGGTAMESFWADGGSEVTVNQTAAEGRTFYGWNGDTDALGLDFKSGSLVFAVTAPVSFTAMYLGGTPRAKTYVGTDKGKWDVDANWDPAGVPTVSDDVTIPTGRRVIGGHKIFAHSVTLEGSAAISQGGHTDAYNEEIFFTDNSSYGKDSNLGRYADSYTDELAYFNDILGDVMLNGSSQWIVGGHNSHPYKTFNVGGDFTQNGTSMVAIYAGKGDMAAAPELGGAALTVAGKATFTSGTILDAFCNFNVNATSVDNDYATGAYVLLKFGSTEIAEGATIRSRLGVGEYTESALKEKSSPCPATSGDWMRGGAHGGAGGATSPSAAGIAAYDCELAPILPGGCGSQARTVGGGVVRIDTGSFVLNGTVSASAVRGTPQHESGAPAGGAVWITCTEYELGANAKLTADGKSAVAFSTHSMGGGAGGRIAIATGLSDEQKTALARTGETTDISGASSLTALYPSVVSVKGGTGIRDGQNGGDGTAVIYKYVDPNKVSVTIMTEPAGLSDAAFAPAVAVSIEKTKGDSFSASAPEVIVLESGKRRLVSGWKAVAQDGTVVASGTGATCEIASVTSTVNLVWLCETLQLRLNLAALGDGTLTGAEAGWRDAGELTLTATPNAGAAFRGWISGGFQTPAEAKSTELKIDFDRPMQIAAVFSGELSARTAKAYVGATGGSWDQDANWDPAGVPTVADDVTIPADTAVTVRESAIAGSLTLGAGATLSVFGQTTSFHESITVNDNHTLSDYGRYCAERDGAPEIAPSVETVGDLTLGEGAVLAVGGWRQRGQSFVRCYGDLTVGAGAKMSVYAGQATERVAYLDGTGRVEVDGAFALQAGALLELVGYNPFYSEYATLSCVPIVCGTFTVAEGAKVAANLPTGYNLSELTSKGGGAGNGLVAGAGHGGCGGAGVNSGNQAGGAAYDSPYAPVYPGCNGRYDNAMNSIGGGVIRVTAYRIRIDGELNVDAKITGPYEYGGASGGSILLVSNGFAAGTNAKLSARGMNGSTYSSFVCAGGAGGRIAICRGLSAEKVAALQTLSDGELPRTLSALDQTADGAKFQSIGDVSGGKGRANTAAEDGEDGTFYFVRSGGFLIWVR